MQIGKKQNKTKQTNKKQKNKTKAFAQCVWLGT